MGLLEKLLEGLKNPIIKSILKKLETMGQSFNEQIAEVGDLAGQNPQSFNGELFQLAKTVNETVVIPLAVVIITFIACYEIIHMVTEKNNFHDFETFIFFKWIFKTTVSIWLVSNSFNFIMAIFAITQDMIQKAVGVGQASVINLADNLDTIEASLKEMNVMELLELNLTLVLSTKAIAVFGIIIWIVCIGRLLEIYFLVSVGALPFATLTSGRFGNVGDNYIKTATALGLQGLFMVLTVSAYSVFVQSLDLTSGDLTKIQLQIIGAALLATITLFKTKTISMSIVGAS